MKVVKWLLISALLLAGIWYFFIKDHQQKITFKTEEATGIVYQHIRDWPTFQRSVDSIETVSGERYSQVVQKIYSNDSLFEYRWNIERIDDSITQVSLFASDVDHAFLQKVKIPFSETDFEKKNIENAKDVLTTLKNTAEEYNVHSITKTTVPSTFCAYLPMQSKTHQKASTMLHNIPITMGYIKNNGMELTGDPFLEITDWNTETETIAFNFCFPIKKSDSLPEHPEIKFKTTQPFEAIKAEFNGNYSISEKAWYYLLDYAAQNDLKVKKRPVEYFRNDPHQGGNPLQWKADIFLPLEK